MKAFVYVASALALGILAGYATAGDCYRTSAVQVQQSYAVPVQVQQAITYAPVQQVQLQAAPVCTYATCAPQTFAAPAYQSYTTAAAFAAPTYYTPALQAPVYRSYVPQQSFSIQHQRQFSPVYSTQFVPGGQFGGGFSPGGFRAGFAGQGLNAGGGSGFLTGGGLLGGAANLLGVSSSGLEGAALGILATRSNLFGLARKR